MGQDKITQMLISEDSQIRELGASILIKDYNIYSLMDYLDTQFYTQEFENVKEPVNVDFTTLRLRSHKKYDSQGFSLYNYEYSVFKNNNILIKFYGCDDSIQTTYEVYGKFR